MFKAPTASCVLAVLERQGYLEGRKETFDAADYVTMIEPIREIAAETGYRPVEVGYALFAYDDRVREGTFTEESQSFQMTVTTPSSVSSVS